MKVNIGPYRNWIGPHQIARAILFWKDKNSDEVYDLGDKISKTFIYPICTWFDKKKKRKVEIRIDDYDTWSMDHTLALIILPMLKQLRATKQGSSGVDDSDVPEHLRSTTKPPVDEYDIDGAWHDRWDWAMDEMIWAFEQIIDEDHDSQFFDHSKTPLVVDFEGLKAHNERIQRGTTLFGKYYRGLWD